MEWITNLNNFLYEYVLIIMLIAVGLYFTCKTKFVQIRLFKEGIHLIKEKNTKEKGITAFQALMISTASRVGTGNIAGVAIAIAIGGAGSIFWMWLLAIIGSASAFIESTLAQIYKVKDGEEYRGGPAYYIQLALKKRWFGILFAVLLILCFAFGFNALQSFNVSSAIKYYATTPEMQHIYAIIVGVVLTLFTAYVIFGGVHRIGVITSYVVPIMAFIYIIIGLYICIVNYDKLFPILQMILEEAFDFTAIFGGFSGSCVMYGMKRGLFSNEAGMGSSPNAAATADVSHPVKQGLVQMLSVFIDTILICTTTAMMLLIYGPVDASKAGMPYVQLAISNELGVWGIHFITISIFLFAFSSLIGNYCYAESNLKFICNNKKCLFLFRILVLIAIYLGAQSDFELVWNIADILMAGMAIVNIIAIIILAPLVIKSLKDYCKQKKEGKDPIFHPKELEIENTQCWE